ncbi:hypothetical protein JCGZ_20933 [Jatropha curcas]|uniref:Uncharacterized protein n=1 Tax=Jatropha curcas TaxID=180498 RepID=A0A067JU35_JATCU|nr:hypothetical protein JCGZ_20933 [Jatropha curcas]
MPNAVVLNPAKAEAEAIFGFEENITKKGKEQTHRESDREMGYVFRVRLASFFAGAATASFVGFYVLYKDYKVAHESISQQVKGLHESLETRISALETLKQAEDSQPAQAAE